MIAQARCQICGHQHSILAACGSDTPSPNASDFDNASDVTKALITQILQRDSHGRAKYGVTLDRDDLCLSDWLQHMAEELMDGAGYALAAKRESDAILNVIVDKAVDAVRSSVDGLTYAQGVDNLAAYIRKMIGKPQPQAPAPMPMDKYISIDKYVVSIREAIHNVLYNNWTDPNCDAAQKAWVELGVHRLVAQLRVSAAPKP